MAYTFRVTTDPDIKFTQVGEGTVEVEFIHPMSLFNLTEELKNIETMLLYALGYGPQQQSKRGPKEEEEK